MAVVSELDFAHQEFRELCDELAIPSAVVHAAVGLLASGSVRQLALSGKQGSGKDTVGPVAIARLGPKTVTHLYFADALKDETDCLLRLVTAAARPELAVEQIADTMRVSGRDAAAVVETIWDAAKRRPIHARMRSPEIRRLLQLWGTDIRRRDDFDWWVKPTMRALVATIAEGHSVYFSDLRFPNEADWSLRCGVFLVRLDVLVDTQVQRILARDGLVPSPDSFAHASEVGLDDYDRFHMRVCNDGPLEQSVSAVVSGMVDHWFN